ncbi:MAG: Uma2 family endonuclease [Pseudomonadota bacterium]
MQLSSEKRTWTEAELMSLPDIAGKYELVEGEPVLTPAATFRHEIVGTQLIIRLGQFVLDQKLGRVGGSSLGCWMRNGNLRCPDVSFISMERSGELGQDIDGFLKGAPDLAVEILSPSNTVKALKEKAVEYFDSGSKLVWIVNPYDRTVLVLRPDQSESLLTAADSLDGEDVVPGFSLAMGELFEGLG